MNKSIALLIIGVISLAMFLIMINHFATSSTPPPLVGVQNPLPQTGIPTTSALNPPAAPARPAAPAAPRTAPVTKTHSSPSVASTSPAQATPVASTSPAQAAPVASQTVKTPAPPVTPTATAPTEKAPRLSPESMVSPASPAYDDVSSTRPPVTAKESSPKPTPKATVPAVKEESKAVVKEGPKTINKIVVSATSDGANVRINGASPLAYKTMHLKSPDRAVVDLEGAWAVKAPGVPGNKAVSNVRIGKQANKTRIVIDLSRTPGAVNFIKVDANTLDVRVK